MRTVLLGLNCYPRPLFPIQSTFPWLFFPVERESQFFSFFHSSFRHEHMIISREPQSCIRTGQGKRERKKNERRERERNKGRNSENVNGLCPRVYFREQLGNQRYQEREEEEEVWVSNTYWCFVLADASK